MVSRRVFSQDVHAIELVVAVLGVAFAFEKLDDGEFATDERGDEPFKHLMVGLVAQEALHGPVESDVDGFCHRVGVFMGYYRRGSGACSLALPQLSQAKLGIFFQVGGGIR